MEQSNHNSALRQKLDQHDFGYRPGAWEGFEQMMNANPMPITTKKSFWNVKKWLGLSSAAVLILGGLYFFNAKSQKDAIILPAAAPAPPAIPTQNIISDQKEEKNSSSYNNEKVKAVIPEKQIQPIETTKKSIEHLSQHDDNSHPQEGELKIRSQQSYQRVSKSGSDDSGVFSVSNQKKETENSTLKKHVPDAHQKAPDAHELEAAPQKKKNK